ncbi:hypothetical protein TNCV_493331 [Trichonephila clavipes]|nr:hypothetical protein TNCV_493331 [Trichonephila clavipes]
MNPSLMIDDEIYRKFPDADDLIETSAHAPQRPMVTYTEMGIVGAGPMGCCATVLVYANNKPVMVDELFSSKDKLDVGFIKECHDISEIKFDHLVS